MRNNFRSTLAHSTLYFDQEQNQFNNIFSLSKKTQHHVLDFSNTCIIIECNYNSIKHIRKFQILEDRLIIEDFANKEIKEYQPFEYYSNGYGKLIKNNV